MKGFTLNDHSNVNENLTFLRFELQVDRPIFMSYLFMIGQLIGYLMVTFKYSSLIIHF